jgi:iron(III) transport system permease protein
MPVAGSESIGKPEGRSWSIPRFKDPTLPVWIGAALFLVFLMIFPLGSIFRASLWGETGFSLGRYVEVFTDAAFLKATWNTVVISFWVGVLSVAVGALLAWLVTRTDLPWKKTDPRSGHGFLCDAAFFGRLRLDLAGRPQRGRAQQVFSFFNGLGWRAL